MPQRLIGGRPSVTPMWIQLWLYRHGDSVIQPMYAVTTITYYDWEVDNQSVSLPSAGLFSSYSDYTMLYTYVVIW